MKVNRLLYLLMFLLVLGCSKKQFDSEDALLEYIKEEENGYLQQKIINGVNFSLLYRPTDLLVSQELKVNASSKTIDSLRSKYDQYLYFNLSMSKNDRELLSNVAGNKQQFGAMVNKLAFGMEQKVHLYTPKKDTIAMADYIYPRMYGMSGETTIMFVYPRDSRMYMEDHFNFTIEDLGFYTGEVKFKIPTEKIENEPQLSF